VSEVVLRLVRAPAVLPASLVESATKRAALRLLANGAASRMRFASFGTTTALAVPVGYVCVARSRES